MNRQELSEQRLQKCLGRLEEKIAWADRAAEGEVTKVPFEGGVGLSDVGLGKRPCFLAFGNRRYATSCYRSIRSSFRLKATRLTADKLTDSTD